jgi:hypothetical protein
MASRRQPIPVQKGGRRGGGWGCSRRAVQERVPASMPIGIDWATNEDLKRRGKGDMLALIHPSSVVRLPFATTEYVMAHLGG